MFPVRVAWDELYEVVWSCRISFPCRLPEGRRQESEPFLTSTPLLSSCDLGPLSHSLTYLTTASCFGAELLSEKAQAKGESRNSLREKNLYRKGRTLFSLRWYPLSRSPSGRISLRQVLSSCCQPPSLFPSEICSSARDY